MSFDQGIVGCFSHSTSTTFIDGGGRTVAAIVASSSYQTCQITPHVGRTGKVQFTVRAAFAGGMTTWTLYARTKRTADTSVTWRATEIEIQRIDGSDPAAIANALVAADFVGVDGAACDVAFVTTSAVLSGSLEVMVKGNQAAASGDLFYVAVDAGA